MATVNSIHYKSLVFMSLWHQEISERTKVISFIILIHFMPAATTETSSTMYTHADVYTWVQTTAELVFRRAYTRVRRGYVVSPCVLGLKRAGYHPRPVVRARKINTRGSVRRRERERRKREDSVVGGSGGGHGDREERRGRGRGEKRTEWKRGWQERKREIQHVPSSSLR